VKKSATESIKIRVMSDEMNNHSCFQKFVNEKSPVKLKSPSPSKSGLLHSYVGVCHTSRSASASFLQQKGLKLYRYVKKAIVI